MSSLVKENSKIFGLFDRRSSDAYISSRTMEARLGGEMQSRNKLPGTDESEYCHLYQVINACQRNHPSAEAPGKKALEHSSDMKLWTHNLSIIICFILLRLVLLL